jgi:hypothetical protein
MPLPVQMLFWFFSSLVKLMQAMLCPQVLHRWAPKEKECYNKKN